MDTPYTMRELDLLTCIINFTVPTLTQGLFSFEKFRKGVERYMQICSVKDEIFAILLLKNKLPERIQQKLKVTSNKEIPHLLNFIKEIKTLAKRKF